METFLICLLLSLAISPALISAKIRDDKLSDDCKTLRAMGFNVFECVKSVYPDRAECVPRGHRSGDRLRRVRGGFDPTNAVCDSRVDCTDGSDEMHAECAPQHKVYCDDELGSWVDGEYLEPFHCDRGDEAFVRRRPISMTMCVSECQVCDGRSDCPNGADELDKNCQRMRPKPHACKFF